MSQATAQPATLPADQPAASPSLDSKTGVKTCPLPPQKVFLKLVFKDPADADRDFPKGVPFQLVYLKDDGTAESKVEVKTGEKGIIEGADSKPGFMADRTKKQFTLEFKQPKKAFIVVEKRGDAALKEEFIEADDPNATSGPLFDALKAGKRCFQLPVAEWTCKNSTWEVKDATNAVVADGVLTKFEKIDEEANAKIGTADKPVTLTLKPGWKHLRWTYYDRWIKGADRLSIPRVLVEAFADKSKGETTPDSVANWDIGDDDKKAVQCIPWIVQADKAKPKPDDKSLYRFKTPADTFIETALDKSKRELKSGTKHDDPGVDRLRFYDLPALWRSFQYYAKIDGGAPDEADLFEKVAAKTTTKDKPLTFCLDDIVLVKKDLTPLTWTAGDRVALLSHLFNKKDAAGNPVADLSAEGIYKPDTANDASYFTEKQSARAEDDRNYFFKIPDWTRLVAYKGNLLDVFDKRVNQGASPDLTKITGARAAVQWIDATDKIPGSNTQTWSGTAWVAAPDGKPKPKRDIAPRPAVTMGGKFFAIQPYYEQRHGVRYSSRFNDASDEGTGRFDMTLLRCCDVAKNAAGDDVERCVNLHYFRFEFNFIDDPGVAPTVTPPDTLPANLPPIAAKPKWKDEIIKNVNNRWNGEDAVNASRAMLLPQDDTKIQIPVVWIAQALPEEQSQFLVDVHMFKWDARDNRGGQLGTGESTTMSHADRTTNDWFPSAHETGHADALPDEYNERWDSCSYTAISYNHNTPADIYEPDGRIPSGQVAASPMMNGNQTIRNRYFWHCAEWARATCKTMGTTVKFKVSYDTYTDYKLPPHPKASRTFAYWPAKYKLSGDGASATDRTAANCCDVYVNMLGKEKWSATDLPAADQPSGGAKANLPYDGILTVIIKLSCTMADATWSGPPTAKQIEGWNTAAMQALEAAHGVVNNRYYVTGDVGSGDQAFTFSRCLVQFSPRFVVLNHPDSAKATGIESTHKRHYQLKWINNGADEGYWETAGGHKELMSQTDWDALKTSSGLDKASLNTAITEYHALAKPKLTDRVNKLQTVITEATIAESVPDVGNAGSVSGVGNAALTAALTAYHAIPDKTKYADRASKLQTVESAASTAESLPALQTPDNQAKKAQVTAIKDAATAKIAELKKLDAAQQIKKSATDAKKYCTDAIKSRTLVVRTTKFAVLRAQLEEYFPNFLALEKASSEIAAADLDAIVARLGINNAQVHRI